jgi:hypothetical protein
VAYLHCTLGIRASVYRWGFFYFFLSFGIGAGYDGMLPVFINFKNHEQGGKTAIMWDGMSICFYLERFGITTFGWAVLWLGSGSVWVSREAYGMTVLHFLFVYFSLRCVCFVTIHLLWRKT